MVGPRTVDHFDVAVESLSVTLSAQEREAIASRIHHSAATDG
jgi:hypothetical protein